MLPEPDRRIIVDDSGDDRAVRWIRETYPEFDLYAHPEREGLAATVQDLWDQSTSEYLFHLEDDFTFNQPVPIDELARLLEDDLSLTQVCLVRQAWSPREKIKGGLIAAFPESYEQHDGYFTHQRLFSLNPCLIPRDVYKLGWDDDNEAGFTRLLVAQDHRFAYWGDGRAWVTHIGTRSSIFGGGGRR